MLHGKRLFPPFGFRTKHEMQTYLFIIESWVSWAGVKTAFRRMQKKKEKKVGDPEIFLEKNRIKKNKRYVHHGKPWSHLVATGGTASLMTTSQLLQICWPSLFHQMKDV